MEEERRLAFVAMTRAEKRLFLSAAGGWNIDGSPRYPSRFVLDIGEQNLEYATRPEEGLVRSAREYIAVMEKDLTQEKRQAAFAVGDRVAHAHFGPGAIVGVDAEKSAYVIQFDAAGTTRMISFRTPLQKA